MDEFLKLAGVYLGVTSFALLGVYAIHEYREIQNDKHFHEKEIMRIQNGYVLQKEDLNNNGVLEEFFEMDGKKFFHSIDGKSIEYLLMDKNGK